MYDLADVLIDESWWCHQISKTQLFPNIGPPWKHWYKLNIMDSFIFHQCLYWSMRKSKVNSMVSLDSLDFTLKERHGQTCL